ncbi:nucleotidyl transferase AbiEii/AbiGii toxin family protein [Edaphobacter aggregans]|uniref:nucleotidyl transferase AbiEii/AbiGii toxin family protein n=1 Tax=Edaphobacter aggregans TaxID=570835 RepID=UPI0005599F78|nr:nucleotidyl transferase AbiEii/AbiGii toxin family protein [Edaphobacter aggregans]
MLTQAQVQRYAFEAGLRDIMIAEKEVVLTFLLQLLSERGVLDRLAFKGGTCLRKMILGSQGRFSTDLDFTGLEEHNHEDVILEMMHAFDQPFHGIQFSLGWKITTKPRMGSPGERTLHMHTLGTQAVTAKLSYRSVSGRLPRCLQQ